MKKFNNKKIKQQKNCIIMLCIGYGIILMAVAIQNIDPGQ